jgi:hypothetical protein
MEDALLIAIRGLAMAAVALLFVWVPLKLIARRSERQAWRRARGLQGQIRTDPDEIPPIQFEPVQCACTHDMEDGYQDMYSGGASVNMIFVGRRCRKCGYSEGIDWGS